MSTERNAFRSGAAIVAGWTVEQLLWSPRTIAMGLVSVSPVGLALLYRSLVAAGLEPPITGTALFGLLTATLGFQFVAPMLSLFYSSGVLLDEIETGRIAYLVSRPRSRGSLIAGKMIGSYLVQVALFVPPVVATFYLAVAPSGWQELGLEFPGLARDVAVALLGLAAYSGLFCLLGTLLRRPVLVGLILVFGWQAGATYVPGLVRQLTIAHHLQALLPHDGTAGALGRLLEGRGPALVSVSVLLAVVVATHSLAAFAFSRREFPGGI